MKKWKITAKVDGKEQEFFVRRVGLDGIPLKEAEAIKEYILPHVRKSKPEIVIGSIEEIK